MGLTNTKLVIVAAQLPADFEGTPQELFEAMIKRMQIKSPAGTNFFQTGDVAPSTNQGPWLKGGTQWWVWSTSQGTYVPLDISESVETLFVVSDTQPDDPTSDEDPNIWLRTRGGRVLAWYFWDGEEWRPGGNQPASGATADRPSDPDDLEQFWDTTLNALIHWERGKWRTVSGVPGDIKFVSTSTLAQALTNNPGWKYLGDIDQSYIGRVLGVASKDPGDSPEDTFATDSGITARAAGDMAGAETHTLDSDEVQQHTHLIGALTALGSGQNIRFYRVDDGDDFSAPAERPPNYASDGGADSASHNGELPDPPSGTILVTSKQLSLEDAGDETMTEAAEAHNNIQPTLYLWALTKE